MKTNSRGVVFTIGLLSVAVFAGCEEDRAGLAGPVLANAAPAFAFAAAEPETPAVPVVINTASPAAPAVNDAAAKPATNVATAAPTTNTTNIVMAPVQPPQLSPALAELVKLIQAGVGTEVLTAYITNSSVPFNVGSSEILYLRDLGAPTTILTTLIQHDSSPEMLARKQAASAVRPLPPGVALTTPATNLFPQRSATMPVQNPPEPVAVNPPAEGGAAAVAPLPPADAVTYEVPVETQPVSYSYFYTSLAPYGTWVDVPGYGSCWRPTAATYTPSWRPYCDGGRWLWSNHGWYWYSDYSWGWAPYHYGRWHRPAGIGWVWQPDTCWGPSWVSWRYSAGYCGWAPLPPSARWVAGVGFHHNSLSVGIGFDFGLGYADYVYCPTTRFCDRRPRDHCVPQHQAQAIHKDTTVINNYVVGNNNTIINHGVGFERVSKVNRGDIRQVTLKDTTIVKDLGTRHERLEPDGKTLVVHRPSVPTLAARGKVPPSSRTVAGVTGLRTYGNNGAAQVISGGAAAGVFAKPSPARSSTLTPSTVSGSATGHKPGVGSVTKPSPIASAAPAEPRTIKPIIIRRPESPIVAGGPAPQPIYPRKASDADDEPASGSVSKPAVARNASPRSEIPSVSRPGAVSKPTPSGVTSARVDSPDSTKNPFAPSASRQPGYSLPSSGNNVVKPSVSPSAPVSRGSVARTDPARVYSEGNAPRAPISRPAESSHSRPSGPVITSPRNYSAPPHSAPSVAPRSESPRPHVSAPSGGGGGGGSRSSGGSPQSSGRSGGDDGKRGR